MGTRMKEAVMLVLDCNAYMTEKSDDDGAANKESGSTMFERVKKYITTMVQQKMIVSPSHEVGLVCFGTKNTHNIVDNEEEGFKHITTSRAIAPLDVTFAKFISALPSPAAAATRAGPLAAIAVAAEELHSHIQGKKYKSKIYVFTNGKSIKHETPQSLDKISETARRIMKEETTLVIAGVTDSVAGAGGGHDDPAGGYAQLRSFCDECGGALSTMEEMDALEPWMVRHVAQVSKSRLPLAIGSLEIPVWAFVSTSREDLPNLKKRSLLAAETSDGPVKMDRTYSVADDIDHEEVPESNRVNAYLYGKHLIPVTKENAGAMTYHTGEKRLQALFTVKLEEVPLHWSLGKADVVSPDPDRPFANVAVSSLAHALQREGLGVVCRFHSRKNSHASLVLLYPRVREESEALYLITLPYSNDFRTLEGPRLPVVDREDEDAAARLIDAMQLTGDDDAELLEPETTPNPGLQNFYQCLIKKAMGEDCETPDPRLVNLLDPAHLPPAIAAAKELSQFCSRFPLAAALPKTSADKKRYWREGPSVVGESTAAPVDISVVKLSKKKKQQGGEGEAAELVVGSADPVGDFNRMLSVKTADLTPRAIEEMKAVIEQNLSVTPLPEELLLNCFTALRAGCKLDAEPDKFNKIVRWVCGLVAKNESLRPLVERLREADLLLISSAESAQSTVAPADSQSFASELFTSSVPAPLT
eukprot:GHVU01131777.1.p1 GENE.GHVU01131777.1~~GHVU01131777.1.p1  ORF type:complete len:702 (+),score=140.92 GHVU01131777.1:247-2352(+)